MDNDALLEPADQRLMDGAEPAYHTGRSAGVLLLHDLSGTPQPLKGLGEVLSHADVSVEVPLLPGHGTSIDDLTDMTWEDWAAAAQLALDELASRTGPVVVGGIAMGATLACWVAASHPSVVGVIAINPRAIPVPEQAMDMLEVMLRDGVTTVPPLGPDVSDRTVHVLAYDTVPVATLVSMFEAMADMSEHWDDLTVPILLVTSARDHRVSPANADWLAERVGGPVERLVLERSFHEATLDVEHDRLDEAALNFVRRVVTEATPAAS